MNKNITILLFLFPLEIYQLNIYGFNLRIFDAVAIIIFIVMLLNFQRISIKYDMSVISLILLTFFGILSSILYSDSAFLALKSTSSYLIIVISTLIFANNFNMNSMSLIRTIIAASLLPAIFENLQFFSYVLLDYKINIPFCEILPCSPAIYEPTFGAYGYLGGLMRPTGFFMSMNRIGTYLIPACLLSLHLSIKTREVKYYFCLFFFTESILISLARNSVISLFIGIMIYVFCMKFLGKNKISITKFSFAFFILLIIFYINSDIEQFRHFNVLDIDKYSDISNSLNFYQHLLAAVNVNINNFGFGQGFQSYDEYVFNKGLVDTYGAHNNFLTVLGESGVGGLFFYSLPLCYLIYLMIKSSKKNFCSKDDFYIFSVIYITLFISGLMRTYYFNPYSFLFVSYAFYIIRNENSRQQKLF